MRAELEASSVRAGEVRAELEGARAELGQCERARSEILGGRSAHEVDAELRKAIEIARARAAASLIDLSRAQHAASQSAAIEEATTRAHADAGVEAERTQVVLDRELLRMGLSNEDACARLSRDPNELRNWQRDLATLDTARAQQQAVCLERARRREAHEMVDPPRIGAEQAQSAIADATDRLRRTRELLHGTRARLDQDDRARERAAEITKELSAQYDRLQVWETLADLIGSANGTKLRVFAQSMTLELLLEHANHHLRDLAPRYRLERVPGEDLALQIIDSDLGDEVRSVGSLSGGESFLVALGLALGLASLSSRHAVVGSLFIDEGFGALDPSSLELVLSTLDALQASGRQVGLISHVPAIAERFDVRVQVIPSGPARSRVELVGGRAVE